MFARVTMVQLQPGVADELSQFITDTVVPAAKRAQGFAGIQVLVNPATNQGITISFWDTEADMAAGEASGGYFTQALAGGARFFAAQPTRETYEVRVKE